MDRQEPLAAAGRRALDAAASGRADGLGPLEAALAGAAPGPESNAWRLALRVARAMVGAPEGPLPAPAELRAFADARSDGARTAAAEICGLLARGALLEVDADAIQAWTALAVELAGPAPQTHLAVRLDLARAWRDLLLGDSGGIEERAHAAQSTAAAARQGGLVIEAVALRAMAALAADRLADATALARRASLMAASERLDAEMSFANLVLARVRRHTGRPHLAARIAGAVGRWAPPPFAAWVGWERALAGDDPAPPTQRSEPAFVARLRSAVSDLLRLLGAARAGRRDEVADAAAALRRGLAHAAPFAVEAEALAAAADPWSAGHPTLAPWAGGASPLPPFGLHGLCAGDETAADHGDTTACVVVRPGQPGRRVLRLGLERAAARLGSAVTGEHDQAQSRTDTGMCVLALAGPAGLPVEEFFRQIYGFAYSPPLHRSILNVLVHRMRKRLPGAAEVERDGDQVRLAAGEPLAILDARCSEPAVQRVLWLLARRGSATAKDAAQVLGIPLRTAQAALQQLAADGSCTASKDGKQLSYRIDDTTFSEPTPYVRV